MNREVIIVIVEDIKDSSIEATRVFTDSSKADAYARKQILDITGGNISEDDIESYIDDGFFQYHDMQVYISTTILEE